jgi:hypothetical protein
MKQTKKGKPAGGGKLNRSQTITLRVDPQLRYLTDLAARTQRRTTSGFIEWAIEMALNNVEMGREKNGEPIILAGEGLILWDVDEADRFVKLAIHFPQLLTHDEQVMWKIIRENNSFWDNGYQGSSTNRDRFLSYINFPKVREYWEMLNGVVDGSAEIGDLPKHEPRDTPAPYSDGFDDIPF